MQQPLTLADVETRLRVSIDHLLEGVQVLTRGWTYAYLNQTAARHAQRTLDDLLGRTIMSCYPGVETTPMFGRLQAVMETRRPDRFRNEFVYPDGTRRWFDLIVEPVPDGICVISLDVTDELRLEEELRHAHKMEALGQLAGGVAHDFNNQLMVITGLCDLLLSEMDAAHPLARDLTDIRDAGRRSAQLTKHLLTFSRRQILDVVPLDLSEVAARTVTMLERLLGERIHVELMLEPSPAILGDAMQLEHVITNLAVNARDAMPGGGRLTIGTKDVTLSEEDARQHALMSAGRYAVLSVADTGEGMTEETKARLFEPFYTTKPAGKGTGLGLSTVYGVTRQMGGYIWVYSERGRGTTFKLHFPAADGFAPVASDEETALPDRPATILVVEDEAGLREFAVRALRRFGYTVHEAASAEDASAALAGGGIDLVLTDVVLPDGTGPDVVARAPAGVRVVFMSGYADLDDRPRAATGDARFLEKPFTIPALMKVVREMLDNAER
ncbi:MAG: response regulator [Acidobacteria bacterium]|nr:response regulator [Acidobacteriota bacterium]